MRIEITVLSRIAIAIKLKAVGRSRSSPPRLAMVWRDEAEVAVRAFGGQLPQMNCLSVWTCRRLSFEKMMPAVDPRVACDVSGREISTHQALRHRRGPELNGMRVWRVSSSSASSAASGVAQLLALIVRGKRSSASDQPSTENCSKPRGCLLRGVMSELVLSRFS